MLRNLGPGHCLRILLIPRDEGSVDDYAMCMGKLGHGREVPFRSSVSGRERDFRLREASNAARGRTSSIEVIGCCEREVALDVLPGRPHEQPRSGLALGVIEVGKAAEHVADISGLELPAE